MISRANMESDSKSARVIARYRGKYRVSIGRDEFWAEITGKMKYQTSAQIDFPLVGDLVKVVLQDNNNAVIKGILPRTSVLKRRAVGKDEIQPIAANIDRIFIVQAVDRDFNLNRVERYLALAATDKIGAVLVLNKADLISENEAKIKMAQICERFGNIKAIFTSVLTGKGIKELREAIKKDQICCFVGSSGVGKSSIINCLLGKNILKTKNISAYTKKGKHVTTHRELFVLDNGGMVIDNPGMREVGMADAGAGVDNVFYNITELSKKCKFSNCTHTSEPGCAVLALLEHGEISREQYENFIKLKKESDYYDMTDLEKRHKDRQFGRMLKNYKRQHK